MRSYLQLDIPPPRLIQAHNAGMSNPTLTVYGATSFTARELLRYLDTHPDGESFNLILSGRNGQKLETAAKGIKRQKELVQCALTDEDEVRDLVARSTVIVNLAGELSPT